MLPQEPPLDSNIEDKRGGSVSSVVCVCVCVCVFCVFLPTSCHSKRLTLLMSSDCSSLGNLKN